MRIFTIILGFGLLFIVYNNQSPQQSTITIHPARKSVAHLVEITVVKKQSLRKTVVYTGTLRARHIARIFTEEQGRITRLPYYESDIVKKNTLLVQLDDTLLRAKLDKAIASHKHASINAQRYQKLANKKILSADELSRSLMEQKIAQAEEKILRTQLNYTKIKAPFTGIITTRLAEVGDVLSANTHILTLIDPSSLVVDVALSELLLSKLKKKDPVLVQIDALGTKKFKGKISRIYPSIEPNSRLGKIEITLLPLPKKAREGQFCRITIKRKIAPKLTLPYSAIRHDNHGKYVFIVNKNNKARRKTIRTGQRFADKIEILSGLYRGQKIVIKGFLGLKVDKKLQIKKINN
jgi:membrane fusion protein (multidrug efflux system)